MLRCIIFFHCIPQRKKTSSVVSQNGKKPFRCIPQQKKTSSIVSHNEKTLFRCIPQWRKISSILGYNVRKPTALLETMGKIFLGYSTLHKILLWCRKQRKNNVLGCGIQ
jgi:hypothetical protein